MLFILFFAVILSPLALALSNAIIRQGLEKGHLFPDVLDAFEPQSELRITYHMTRMLQMGTTIDAQEVEEQPHVWFSKTNDVSQYTLVLMDPDHEENAPYLHWLVTNIDGQRPASDVSNDDPLFQYIPYTAPTASDNPHRYVFALLEQSQQNQTMTPENPRLDRAAFDINKFAKDNNMKVVTALYM
ncbi:PEBP-like protein, partial [Lichtheimia hyalospora FSU 10163]